MHTQAVGNCLPVVVHALIPKGADLTALPVTASADILKWNVVKWRGDIVKWQQDKEQLLRRQALPGLLKELIVELAPEHTCTMPQNGGQRVWCRCWVGIWDKDDTTGYFICVTAVGDHDSWYGFTGAVPYSKVHATSAPCLK